VLGTVLLSAGNDANADVSFAARAVASTGVRINAVALVVEDGILTGVAHT
jgi:hypothetical protein